MSRRWCKYPGCEAQLHSRNHSGLCVLHTHAEGICGCPKCSGTGIRRKVAAEREGIRQAEVPYATSNSGVPGVAKVSLAREPWFSIGELAAGLVKKAEARE